MNKTPRTVAWVVVVGLVVAMLGLAAGSGFAETGPASAARSCTVPKLTKLTLKQATAKLKKAGCGRPKVSRTYSAKIKKGRVVKQSPKAKKKLRGGGRVTIWLSLGKKLCVVKKRNKKGKLVTVYQTKIVKVHGKKKRVFVYRYVTKKVHGKKKRVKVKVPKMGPCKGSKKTKSPGIPVTIDIVDPSAAHLDFGGFQRDVPLGGTVKGFIVGKGFVLGQDNQIQLSRANITLEPTGIFIDDSCNGEVSDAIRTDPYSHIELDEGTTGNQVNVAPNSSITGLVHMHIFTSLDMRNDDTGCHDPYITTGWTDFSIPLFLKGKLTPGKGGLVSTLSTGETVLDELSACLAPGDPTLPCNGFAIPFPAILTSTIVGIVHIGR